MTSRDPAPCSNSRPKQHRNLGESLTLWGLPMPQRSEDLSLPCLAASWDCLKGSSQIKAISCCYHPVAGGGCLWGPRDSEQTEASFSQGTTLLPPPHLDPAPGLCKCHLILPYPIRIPRPQEGRGHSGGSLYIKHRCSHKEQT